MNPLLIIDTSYLIYRSYFAFKNLSTEEGVPTGAFYGFVRAVFQMYEEINPSVLVFAIDTPQKTWRHDTYEGYKATRSETDQEMITQIPFILEWVRSITPNVFGKEGFEADDIIYTTAKTYLLSNGVESSNTTQNNRTNQSEVAPRISNTGRSVLIFSSDKDLYQIFTIDGVKFVRTKVKDSGYNYYDYSDFKTQYNLEASQWVDAKALIGDASDNLLGIPSIGPKTASSLLNEFGYLYCFFEAIGYDSSVFRPHSLTANWQKKANEFIKNPKKEKYSGLLKDNYEQLKKMYTLAKLSDTGSLELELTRPMFQKGQGLLEKYDFKSLISQSSKLSAVSSMPQGLFE